MASVVKRYCRVYYATVYIASAAVPHAGFLMYSTRLH